MSSGEVDPDRFDALLRPEIDRLYRLAYRLTNDVADAEDLVQDVLVKVYERRDELTSIDVLGPWLGRVLYNRFVDNHRRYARKRVRTVSIDAAGPEGDSDGLALPSPDAGPDVLAAREFDITALAAALDRLSLDHRSVLLMHDAEGYKLEEIQTITGSPLGTLKSRLHRARARLRGLLEEDGTF